MNQPHISIVSPVYGCNTCLYELYFRLKETLEKITPDFEIILVNDASPDGAWNTIVQLANKDQRVKGINFSRNFGQHYAISAGLDHCKGDWVVVMDCDLQDSPEEIWNLYNFASENDFDIVWGRRIERKHSLLKRLTSRLFYIVFDFLSGYTSDPTVANFSIIKLKVAFAHSSMKEQNRGYPLFIKWLGFKVGYINIQHLDRLEGTSSYNFKKLFRLALDSILAYSNKPLRIGLYFGLLVSFFSMLFVFYLLVKYFVTGVSVTGWTSLIVSLWFISGLIMSFLGLLGLYIGKIFDENKRRPIYVVSETLNL